METIIVTRHEALIQYLIEQGVVEEGTKVISHATPEDVNGKHVIGVLPLRLAALTAKVTEVPLNIPAEMRGKELSIKDVRKYAGEITSYEVRKV